MNDAHQRWNDILFEYMWVGLVLVAIVPPTEHSPDSPFQQQPPISLLDHGRTTVSRILGIQIDTKIIPACLHLHLSGTVRLIG